MPYHFVGDRPFAVAQTDIDGKLIYFDDAFAKMLGVEPLELLNRSFTDFTHPDYLQVSKILLLQILKTGEPYRIEKVYRTPRGDVPILAHVCLLQDLDGSPTGIAAIIQPRI